MTVTIRHGTKRAVPRPTTELARLLQDAEATILRLDAESERILHHYPLTEVGTVRADCIERDIAQRRDRWIDYTCVNPGCTYRCLSLYHVRSGGWTCPQCATQTAPSLTRIVQAEGLYLDLLRSDLRRLGCAMPHRRDRFEPIESDAAFRARIDNGYRKALHATLALQEHPTPVLVAVPVPPKAGHVPPEFHCAERLWFAPPYAEPDARPTFVTPSS